MIPPPTELKFQAKAIFEYIFEKLDTSLDRDKNNYFYDLYREGGLDNAAGTLAMHFAGVPVSEDMVRYSKRALAAYVKYVNEDPHRVSLMGPVVALPGQ